MRNRQLLLVASHRVAVMASAAALVSFAPGCMVDSRHCEHGDCEPMSGGGAYAGAGGSPASEKIVVAHIDTGQTLSTEPGKGAGVFIDYAEGGYWHVYASCDSTLYGESCWWNVVVSAPSGAPILEPAIYSAEASDGDRLLYPSLGAVELETETWSDFDGMRFKTIPGEVVRFDVYLSGVRDARYIYWVGDGAIHKGAPSDPIDLKPSQP